MDILSLWNDDPVEVLLDLGFGTDESELSGRIPARFINHPSQARGINLQVFLESQKNRLDLENPHVNNRFRQLEVFQQVTTAFSSLVGSSCSHLRVAQGKDLPPDALERRKRVGMLFRRASKKSLSHIRNSNAPKLTTPTFPNFAASEPLQPLPSPGDKTVPLTRVSPGPQEMQGLRAPKEEHGVPDPHASFHMAYLAVQEVALRPFSMSEGQPTIALEWKNPGKVKGSLEINEALFDLSGRSGEKPGSPCHLLWESFTSTSDVQSPLPFLPLPCPPPEHLLASDSSSSPVPKSDRQRSEMEKPPDGYQSSPASLPALICTYMYLPFCYPALETQHATLLRFPTPQSPAPLSPMASLMQPASMIRRWTEMEDNNASPPSSPHLSTIQHSEGKASSTISTAPASSPFPFPHLDSQFLASIAESSELAEVVLHEHSISAYDSLMFLGPSPPNLTTYTMPDFYCPSSLAPPPQIESLSQSPESHQNYSLLPNPPTNKHTKEEETPPSFSFELYMDSPLVTPCLLLDSFRKVGAKLPPKTPNPSIPVFHSSFESKLCEPDSLVNPDVRIISDLTEQSISQQDRSYSHDNNTDPPSTSAAQNITSVKIDHLSLEDTLQTNAKGEVEVEIYPEYVQTKEGRGYSSDTNSSASLSELLFRAECNEPQAMCSLHPMETEAKELGQIERNVTENESPRSFLHDDIPEAQIITEVQCEKRIFQDLVEIDSLDQVFHTSVDDSEGDDTDMEAFFQQIDTEGLVYWAEPIEVSNPTPVLGRSFEASEGFPGNFLLPTSPTAPDSSKTKAITLPLSSSTTMDANQTASSDRTSPFTPTASLSQSITPDLKLSNRSVSVQMSSPLSSHIVHRKDVPFRTESRHIPLPSILHLDTSTPFRAVQSWTDLQLKQNILTKKYSHEAAHAVLSPSPALPVLSNDRQSCDCCYYGMARCDHTVSDSVDEELRPGDHLNMDGDEEEKLWCQTATMACYCTCDLCDLQRSYCSQRSCRKQQALGVIPCPMDNIQEMIECLQQFCSVFTSMEQQLSEDQTAAYCGLSDQDREKFWDREELRQAVKLEAAELHMQLTDVAHLCDDSLKPKMTRLLEDQALLCSGLRVFLPGTAPTPLSSAPTRTVATQCCLLSWIPPANM